MQPDIAIYIPWVAWAVSWTIAAVWANATVNRPAIGSQMLYRLITTAGFFLLLAYVVQPAPGWHTWHVRPAVNLMPLWSLPDAVQWAMVGLTALGFLFCWWARIHLGVLWSGSVTRKEGHHVIDTGPYAVVRHPIYTGIIIAAFATMVERGTPTAIAGAALITVGYWIKGRLEERFLRRELGAEAYDAYARKTAMLIPFVKL